MLIAIPMKVPHSTRSFLLTAVTKPLKVNQKLNSGPAKQNLIVIHTFKMKAHFSFSPGDLLSRWNDFPQDLFYFSHSFPGVLENFSTGHACFVRFPTMSNMVDDT